MTIVKNVCVVGASGTVGLALSERLSSLKNVAMTRLTRDTPAAGREVLLDLADLVVLCLPASVSREFAESVPAGKRILDCSSVHRQSSGWVYGLPELSREQPSVIRSATRVANPGCFATGAVLALRPLSDLLGSYPVSVFGVGGVSSGGRRLLEEHAQSPVSHRLYGLDLQHRHTAEIAHHAGLSALPTFLPNVGGFERGTMVQVPLCLRSLNVSAEDLMLRYRQAYDGTDVRVARGEQAAYLAADERVGSDDAVLRLNFDEASRRAVVTVTFDNLGKGAAGAALRNILLMLGQD